VTAALEFIAPVVDGRLPDRDARRIGEAIRRLDGKRVVVTVKEAKRKRSTSANAYLWGVVYPPIVAEFRRHGNLVDSEDIHLFCKQHVGKLRQVLVTPDGEVLNATGSTRHLSTSEFGKYVDAVIAWSAEVLGIAIPLPDEGRLA
jgi:hypothetical protein